MGRQKLIAMDIFDSDEAYADGSFDNDNDDLDKEEESGLGEADRYD